MSLLTKEIAMDATAVRAGITVSNETLDQDMVKICLYNPKDPVDVVPVGGGVFFIPKGESHNWHVPAAERLKQYTMKAFHPSAIDGLLASKLVSYGTGVKVIGNKAEGYLIVDLD